MPLNDDLSRAAGGGVPIRFRGEDLILPPITMEIIATVKQHLLKQRPKPAEVMRDHLMTLQEAGLLTDDLKEKIVAESMTAARRANVVTDRELAEYIDTIDGIAMTLWVAFDKRYPGKFTRDDVIAACMEMSEAEKKEIVDARDQAAGWDDQGNSTGPTPATVSGPTEASS